MSRYKIKKPEFTAIELNSNIAYGTTSVNNITKEELDSIQWLCEKSINDDIKIKNLQSQLAEKDKRIRQLKLDLGMFKSVNEFINSYGIEKAREVLLQSEKTKNQDKISFALEQLEELSRYFRDYDNSSTHTTYEVLYQISRKVNELKGEQK